MTAEILRKAAALMRERAEAAQTHTPWTVTDHRDEYATPWTVTSVHPPGERTWVCRADSHSAEHIASWHPAAALAVADWLGDVADRREDREQVAAVRLEDFDRALSVARAYLGSADD